MSDASVIQRPWLLVGQRGVPGATLGLSFMNPGTLDPRITFTRASTATYFDATGTMQTAAINAPRWDYDPVTHALRGLLMEEARTNLLLNSATLGTQSVTVTAVATTLSFYGTGTVTLSGVSTAGPLTGTGATNRVALTFTPTAGTLTCTVTGSVTNAQLEAGSFITSYIPTTAAAATRAQDNMTQALDTWFSAAQGTFEADCVFQFVPAPAVANFEFIAFGPSVSNLIRAVIFGGGTATTVQVWSTNVSRGSSTVANAVTAGTVSKYALTYVAGTLAVSNVCNGGAVASVTASAFPALTTSVYFGGCSGRGGLLNGWVRRVRYWPRVLSNAEMQSVTT